MERFKRNHVFKRICTIVLCIAMVFTVQVPITQPVHATEARTANYELVDDVQNGEILHCFNWSYKTIEDNLQLIAESGYSAVQTSPATQPKDYTYEGVVYNEVGFPGVPQSGNWWKMYQPVAECVCNNGQTWLGSKADLESLCAKAEQYGIKVIVDVVANHMGNIKGYQNSLSDVSPQVGEYWNKDMLTDESFWHINDMNCGHSDTRLSFTQGSGGMPDLNTANKLVQKYIADYLDELIDCGVDGFRFDMAKHIETPDDDPSIASDFWPTVLGEANSHYTNKTGKKLYIYGEILNTVGLDFSIDAYTKYMKVTDNSAGDHMLDGFRNNSLNTLDMTYNPSDSVIWAECHDTYMNTSSRFASDKTVVRAWSRVANKNQTASLFFARPYYSSDTLINDQDNQINESISSSLTPATMGNCETYVWASDEVAAINHFNNRMAGKPDNTGNDGNIAYSVRGDGIVLASFNGKGDISMSSHGLADGNYTDEVSRNTFTVQNGTLRGTITSDYGIAVIYKNVMPNPSHLYPVQIKNSVGDGSKFYGDSLKVTLSELYADQASYTATTGESGTFNGTKTITIGSGLEKGDTVTLTVTGSNAKGPVTKTYTYIKDEYDISNCVFFKNTNNWEQPTAYLWTTGKNNSSWPGEKMFEIDAENGIYALQIDPEVTFDKVIFSNNGNGQTADLAFPGIGYEYIQSTGEWVEYNVPGPKAPSIKSTKDSAIITGATDVTITVDNANQASYTLNGGAPVSFTGSTTVKVGANLAEGKKDTLVITATNDAKSTTKTYTYTMDYKQPEITASVASGTSFDETLPVTFTVSHAGSAEITVNGTKESFTGSITKTLTKTSVVTVSAINGTKNASETYRYTKNGDNFIYFNVSACGWFGNDKAVLGVKFDGETTYTKCEAITENGVTYYQAAVPENATKGSICRLLPSGNTYNEVAFTIENGKNVWTGNSSFNYGTWSTK